jgi:ElaB/YqjD/DUF883 family membrane-anchored ribosome-binding protein
MVEQIQETSQFGASTDKIKEGARELKDAVSETASRKAGEYKELASKKFDEYSSQANDFIQEKPLTSLAIAFGVGAVLGMLMFSGRRD